MEVDQVNRMLKGVILILFAFFFFTIANEVQAQRGGGSRHGGSWQGPASGSSQSQIEIREQQRQQIRATDQQREQYQITMQSMDRLRTRVRNMERMVKDPETKKDQIREEQERLRNEVRNMEQEHHRFMEGLSTEQKMQLRHRLLEMDQIRERINAHVQAMEEEMNRSNPKLKEMGRRMVETEREINEWQKRLREIGSEMGIRS